MTTTTKYYTITDREADYVLTHWNGFEQRCPNAASLQRAITHAESLDQTMDPYSTETARCANDARQNGCRS